MRIKYSRGADILTIRLSEIQGDHTEETDGVITHLSAGGKPVLIEIQGGKAFVLSSITSLVNDEEVRLP